MHRGADRLPGWGANGWGHGDTTNWGARELLGASGACGGDTLGEESSRDGVNGKSLGGAACRGELQLGWGHCGHRGMRGCARAPLREGRCHGLQLRGWPRREVAGDVGEAQGPRGTCTGEKRALVCPGSERVPGDVGAAPAGPGLCEGAES